MAVSKVSKNSPKPKIGKPGGAKKVAARMTKLREDVKKNAVKVAKEINQSSTFKVGEVVRKELLFFGQVSETQNQEIHSIENGVIYLSDSSGERENGITYNLKGEEIERFFLPHTLSRIVKK